MMPLGMEAGLGPGHNVLDGDQAPQFSVHVCCGQTAGYIKIPLGTEVGPGQCDIVLDRNLALAPRKGAQFVYAVSGIFLLPVRRFGCRR